MHRSVRATEDEATRTLPGDDLIDRPGGSLTHAVTITGVARDVWPWLAQMGAGSRAGWYSYDVLDNGRRPSAARIIPELQSLEVGMVFPALPGATDAFSLVAYEPERFLVLGWLAPDGSPRATWAFVLEQRKHTVRLLVRARGAADYSFHGLPRWVSRHLIRLIHFVMQRKQLMEVARRVERPPLGAVRPTSSTGASQCSA